MDKLASVVGVALSFGLVSVHTKGDTQTEDRTTAQEERSETPPEPILLFCENQNLKYRKTMYYLLDLEAGTFIWQEGWRNEDGNFDEINKIESIDEYKINFTRYFSGRFDPGIYMYLDRRTLVLRSGRKPTFEDYKQDGPFDAWWQCEIAAKKKL